VRYFSRRAVDTFQRALVHLFVGLLVGSYPLLIFLPCLVIETRTGEDWVGSAGGSAPLRRNYVRLVGWLCCHCC
jgi:hypothetical protein